MSDVIALEDVTLRHGRTAVLDRLDLYVPAGEILALLGRSGSGKTTLLRVILGFAVPETGMVFLGDRMVSQDSEILVPPEDRALGVVFQDLALWPHLTVEAHLGFGLAAKGVNRVTRQARIAEMLRRVGLSGCEARYPGELSGGERQRVAIARALVVEPRAVLLDEPLANVDVDLRRELLALFRELFVEKGVTAIHVTHDLREATAVASRLAVIEGGRIVQRNCLTDLRAAPATPFVASLVDDLSVAEG